MFYLHASNRTENLLQHLAALIAAAPPRTIFEKEYFLIQSQGMERMISQYLARYFTSWCNYRFLLPLTFLEEIAERLEMTITPDSFEREILGWRLEEKLRDLTEDVYHPLRHYLQGEQAALKRFQLARQIANIFDQYQLMRPQMLEGWKKNILTTREPAERWQMHLWNRLLADDVAGRPRGEVLQDIIAELHRASSLPGIPKRVSVFGVHILPPVFLDYLQALARHTDVHLFLLSPCKHYWGDITRRNLRDEQDAVSTDRHPLLAALGRQGRDFQELLLDRIDIASEITSYDEPLETGQPSLLTKLQSDLLAGSINVRRDGRRNDGSIRIVSCHSKMRELEILKDHVIDLLEQEGDLQLDDIVIMAPDIQEYSALIPAVFEDIDHSIADRSLARRNIYITIYQQFLDLLSGRFGWSELLDVLEKEQVYHRFNLTAADLERLRRWTAEAGVRWGLSPRQRERQGFTYAENTWSGGLERLLLGVAADIEEEVAGIYPFTEIEGGEAAALGGLCEFVLVIEQAEEEVRRAHQLTEWSDLLVKYGRLLFGDEEARDYLELLSLLQTFSDYGSFHRGLVEFQVVAKWFAQVSSQAKSASGFLKGSLTFCSMLPMRSIPFKAICLLGLNYGMFPNNDKVATYDLLKKHALPGDRSLRADDRYQFLEVLLAARQTLYLSYVGQSLQNNDKLPPSVVVAELLEVLENYYGAENLVEQHPLHGFSRRYFNPEETLFSYSREDCQTAIRLQAGPRQQKSWWRGKIENVANAVEIADLLAFFNHPQRYFVERCLGISLREGESSGEDSEIFDLQGLTSYKVMQTLLDAALHHKDLQQAHRRLCVDGLWPLGVPGNLLFSERKQEIEELVVREEGLELGKRLPDMVLDLNFEGSNISGTLGNIYEGGILYCRYAELKARDMLTGWLIHLLACVYGNLAPRTIILMKDKRIVHEKDQDRLPPLDELLKIYRQGRGEPSKLLLDPALEYCLQHHRNRSYLSPLEKARQTFELRIDNGYEPAWQLLYENLESGLVLDEEFQRLSELVFMPLAGSW